MNDDWRLQVDLHDASDARSLVELLDSSELQHDLSAAFHDRVIVSQDDARVFLYAGSREQAEHEALIAAERRETEERGYPEFEVRADLPSRHDATSFAERPPNPFAVHPPPVKVGADRPLEVVDERVQLIVWPGPVEVAVCVLDIAVEGRDGRVDQLGHRLSPGSIRSTPPPPRSSLRRR
jgi:hypothetical protein